MVQSSSVGGSGPPPNYIEAGFVQLLQSISLWQLLISGCLSFTLFIVWLHHTAHYTANIVSVHLCMGSASVERVGLGEMGGLTHRVLHVHMAAARFGCKESHSWH